MDRHAAKEQPNQQNVLLTMQDRVFGRLPELLEACLLSRDAGQDHLGFLTIFCRYDLPVIRLLVGVLVRSSDCPANYGLRAWPRHHRIQRSNHALRHAAKRAGHLNPK